MTAWPPVSASSRNHNRPVPSPICPLAPRALSHILARLPPSAQDIGGDTEHLHPIPPGGRNDLPALFGGKAGGSSPFHRMALRVAQYPFRHDLFKALHVVAEAVDALGVPGDKPARNLH